MKRIIAQDLLWDEKTNKTSILTKFDDQSILVEPVTTEEASQFLAERKF